MRPAEESRLVLVTSTSELRVGMRCEVRPCPCGGRHAFVLINRMRGLTFKGDADEGFSIDPMFPCLPPVVARMTAGIGLGALSMLIGRRLLYRRVDLEGDDAVYRSELLLEEMLAQRRALTVQIERNEVTRAR